MKATRQLHELHSSVGLETISRDSLSSRALEQRLDEISVSYPAPAIRMFQQEE
jgi:hypothetical protein